jgi:hypothetical protein
MSVEAGKLTVNSVCVPSEDVVTRDIEGDLIIVPLVSGMGGSEDELYTLNETGKVIWQKLDGKRTLSAVIEDLGAEFEGDPEELKADVLGFVSELMRRNMLTHVREG